MLGAARPKHSVMAVTVTELSPRALRADLGAVDVHSM